MRIEPPPSPPSARGAERPAATATAEPVDEPPATRSGACGLRGMTRVGFTPSGVMPYSVIGVCPRMTAPAARRRATKVESAAAIVAQHVGEVAAAARGQALDPELLLDRDRHAVERPARRARLPAGSRRVGVPPRAAVAVLHERAHARAAGRERARGVEGAVGELPGRGRAVAEGLRERLGRPAPRRRGEREARVGGLARTAPGEGAVVDGHVAEERVRQLLEEPDAQVGAEDRVEEARAGVRLRKALHGVARATRDARGKGHGRDYTAAMKRRILWVDPGLAARRSPRAGARRPR